LGATAKAIAMDDFLSSEDPWFRPVDIRLSADGHFYVADFYNKIIGHYEVPLDHPGRDRTSGRIWQIRYVPNKTTEASGSTPDERFNETESSIQSLSESAGNKLADRSALAEAELFSAAQSKLAAVRVKALSLIPELAEVSPRLLKLTRQLLGDPNPHVQRAAAESLGQYGDDGDLFALMDLLSQVDETDPVLRQTIRIAVRAILQTTPANADIWLAEVDAEMASILLGLPNRQAAAMILRYLNRNPDADNRDPLLAHAVKHADAALLQQAVDLARASTAKDVDQAFLMLDVMCSAQNIGTGNVPKPLLDWANELVRSSLLAIDPNKRLIVWSASQPNSKTQGDGQTQGNGQPQGDWPSELRQTSDAGEQSLTSSFGRGESYVGRLISEPFLAPKSIRFYLAGHNGFPDQPDHGKNRIQLVSQSTGELLAEATPPRNDRAVVVTWNIQQYAGEWVRIECVDNDSAGAYAWIAFGNFQPAWLHQSDSAVSLRRSLAWIDRLKLGDSLALLESIVANSNFSAPLRAEVLSTIVSLDGNQAAVTILASLLATGSPVASIKQAIDAFRAEDADGWNEVIKQLCKRFTASDQREFCSRWLRSGASIDELIDLVEAGWISSRALVDPDVEQLLQPRLNPNQQMRINELTQGLEENLVLVTRLKELQQQVRSENGNADRGKQLYTQHCATCHQLRGQGAVVGPQLDGAATRSVTRLLEDIVTPDRNVDRAFRTTSLLLEDGRVLAGLVTDETDQVITLVESSGKPIKIDQSVIEVRKDAGRSLMPANLGEVLNATDFEDLLNYLRS
jgi:putative heme-binding domain-containing protein